MAEGRRGGRTPTTAPPPFDPVQFARDSEMALRASTPTPLSSGLVPVAPPPPLPLPPPPHSTLQLPSAPPLNKKVSLKVPLSDLDWFELSAPAVALAGALDGEHTLLEIIERMSSESTPAGLDAVAELQDAALLQFED